MATTSNPPVPEDQLRIHQLMDDMWWDVSVFLPVGFTNGAIFFEVSNDINHAQSFIDAASEYEIVDQLVLNDPFFVNDEGAPKGDHGAVGMQLPIITVLVIAEQHIVVCGNALRRIRNYRVFDGANAALFRRQLGVNFVGLH